MAICRIDGCGKASIAKTLCMKHYMRQWTNGTTDIIRKPSTSPLDRFWKFVNKSGPMHSALGTPCWAWTGAKTSRGYGQISTVRGKSPAIAPRISYEIHFGGIPCGLDVLHKCDNPACVNPEHLFVGTAKDNADDMINKGRHAHGERHPLSKLKEDEVRAIRADERSAAQIAADYGVSRSNVRRVKIRKLWAHIA